MAPNSIDPKAVVTDGYDRIADAYLAECGSSVVRERWLETLLSLLPAKARVLDLGCGAGVPVCRRLAEAGHDVLGLDGSARQVALARANVPGAEFVQADMAAAAFERGSFDAVAAFYSITHLPRAEHAGLFRRLAEWLRPGGVFLASLGATATPEWSGDWLGAPMYFSHFDAETNLALIRQAGLAVERAEVVPQDDEDGSFLWVVARAPA